MFAEQIIAAFERRRLIDLLIIFFNSFGLEKRIGDTRSANRKSRHNTHGRRRWLCWHRAEQAEPTNGVHEGKAQDSRQHHVGSETWTVAQDRCQVVGELFIFNEELFLLLFDEVLNCTFIIPTSSWTFSSRQSILLLILWWFLVLIVQLLIKRDFYIKNGLKKIRTETFIWRKSFHTASRRILSRCSRSWCLIFRSCKGLQWIHLINHSASWRLPLHSS